jgi:peptidoglycan/LPS O-acetylase OafA/YrhL
VTEAQIDDVATSAFTLGYRPWLDGLRAIAIVAVVVFHIGAFRAFTRGTGAAGVDMFFVLSGFLITILLLEERERTGAISLRAFYRRRARRLLPALALVVAGVLLASWFGLLQASRHATLVNVGYVAAYVGNWVCALTSNRLGLLGPTWSLSIEEQFYLLWPVTLIALLRWDLVGRRLLVVLLSGAGVSMLWYEFLRHGTVAQQERAYFGTDSRAYALLFGCAVAVAMHWGLQPTSRRWVRARAVLAAGAGAFLAVFFLVGSVLPRTSNYYLEITAAATAILILHLSSTRVGWAHRALAIPPLVWIGRVAYGIYLIHFPVIKLLTPQRTDLHGYALAALDIGVTAVLAAASYFLVERRFLAPRRRWQTQPPWAR